MFQREANTPDTTSIDNLRRLLVLRAIILACEILLLILATNMLALSLPLTPITLIITAHALVNIVSWQRLRQDPGSIGVTAFFVQLLVDVAALGALLYFTGGSTNPFVSLFLLPLVIAAAILPLRHVWAMAALVVTSYSFLMFYYLPLPSWHNESGQGFGLHVIGMWFGFLLSAGLIVFFVARMAGSLRERDRILNETREQAMRGQHLVAMGALATGAAHELGTPLSTMAVLANELKRDHSHDADVVGKAEMLRSQLDRCKKILSDITASTGQARPEGGRTLAIDDYLQGVAALLRNSRPGARLACRFSGSRPPPRILADKTLTQALLNVLNNAADASIENIEMEGRWDDDHLTLAINDRGRGISRAEQAAAFTPFYTTKSHGQGLGLYLTRAVLERFGGEITLHNREDGGVRALIELPLTPIKVPL